MSNSNPPFNPVLLLYLNPELGAYSNIISVEAARDYYNASNVSSNMWYTLDPIPPIFEEGVFIGDHKTQINISGLNQTIKTSLLNEGESPEDLERQGTYLSTIYRNASLRSNNTFKFNLPGDATTYGVTISNMNVGDRVKIVKNNSEFHYATLSSVINSETVVLSNDRYPFIDSNAEYLIYGIKLYDPLRLARINYLRLSPTMSNVRDFNFVNVDPNFNVELYQLLYPDSRLLDRDAAFIDYTNRHANNEERIANARELLSDSNIYDTYKFMTVTNILDLSFSQPTGRVIWNGMNLYYATSNDSRKAADIPPFFDGIITERAIKTYIDRAFQTEARFNNVIVMQDTTLNRVTASNAVIDRATICNLLVTGGGFTISNNINFDIYAPTTFFGPITTSNAMTFGAPAVFLAEAKFNNAIIATQATSLNRVTASNAVIDRATICNLLVTGGGFTVSNNTNFDIYAPTTFFGPITTSNAAAMTFGAPAVFLDTFETHAATSFYGSNAFSNITTFWADTILNGPVIVNGASTINGHSTFVGDVMTTGTVTLGGACNFASGKFDFNRITASNALLKTVTGSYAEFETIRTSNLYAKFSINDSYVSVSNISQYIFASNVYAVKADVSDHFTSYFSHLNYVEASNIKVIDLQTTSATFAGSVSFCNDVAFDANVAVGGALYGSIIGISDLLTIAPPAFATLSNVVLDNMVINDTMSINSLLEVGNNSTTETTVVKVNGFLEAVNIDFTSDKRLKHRLRKLSKEETDCAVDGIVPTMFEYKHKHLDAPKYGFIAQNIEQYFGSAINEIHDYKMPLNRLCKVVHLNGQHIVYPDHRFSKGDELTITFVERTEKLETYICKVTDFTDNTFTIDHMTDALMCKVNDISYASVKSVDYPQIIALLFNAVKDLKNRVTELEK